MIKKITILFFIAILCSISYHSISYGSGPPTAYTNASGEGNCTSCHSGSLITSGSDWNNIAVSSNFTGNGYIPDSTYAIKISHNQSGISKWGFEMTVLDASNNKVGTLSVPTGSTRVQKQSTSSRDYMLHTSSGTSSTGTNSTDWVINWKAPTKNIGPVKIFACVIAANGNSNESGDQVYAKSFTINPSGLLPVANATCADSITCAGNTITLKGASTQNPTSWTWTLTGATPNASTSQNPSVKYNNPGTFWAILVSKNTKGISKADSLKIVVRNKPTVSVTPNVGTYTFCKGDSLKLTAGFNANYAYTWSPGGGVTQSIWAKDTGKYTVTVTDNNKCSNTSGIVKIVHHPVHTLSLSRDVTNDTICYEIPVKITASGSTTFDSIKYYTSAGLFQTTDVNPHSIKFSASTDLYAKGKDSKGCITAASNKFEFVVKSGIKAPVANCTNKTTASFEISWDSVTNAKGYQISIDSGKTWKTPSSGIKGLSHKVLGFPPNTDVEVQLKAIDIFPCYESPTTKVVCGSIPCSPITYDIIWDKEVCKAKDINFKIRNLKTSYYSLSIDKGKAFRDTSFVITADFSRTYKFELTDSSNLSCPTIKRDAAVIVWEIPSLALKSNNVQNIFCQGNSASFEAVAKGMQEYEFILNNISKQKSNSGNWNYSTPQNLDSVWVKVTNGACLETSDKLKLGVKPLPTAKFTYTFDGRTASFKANETLKATYNWSFGDGTTDTLKNPVHKYAGSGTSNVWAKLTVIDEFGCSSTDSSLLEIPASINNTFQDYGINVYPQPAKNSFTIEIPSDLVNAEIGMMDATGRMVIKTIADKKVTEIITTDLPSGVYMLMVTKGTNRFNGKVIISR
jgi:PKD repeat protein